jgi:hypothetical protein
MEPTAAGAVPTTPGSLAFSNKHLHEHTWQCRLVGPDIQLSQWEGTEGGGGVSSTAGRSAPAGSSSLLPIGVPTPTMEPCGRQPAGFSAPPSWRSLGVGASQDPTAAHHAGGSQGAGADVAVFVTMAGVDRRAAGGSAIAASQRPGNGDELDQEVPMGVQGGAGPVGAGLGLPHKPCDSGGCSPAVCPPAVAKLELEAGRALVDTPPPSPPLPPGSPGRTRGPLLDASKGKSPEVPSPPQPVPLRGTCVSVCVCVTCGLYDDAALTTHYQCVRSLPT